LLRLAFRSMALVSLLAAAAPAASAQSAVDVAMAFYEAGGAYCFRIAPFGTALSEETHWTVMVLTSTSNRQNTFRIRTVDPGATGLKGARLQSAGTYANDVWKFDGPKAEFFERFSRGIREGRLRARVVQAGPPNLAQITSERERAELYLTFADKGSKVSFDNVPNLTADEFQQYSDYFPD
jgi:hypothetical protein